MIQTSSKLDIKPRCLYVIEFFKVKKIESLGATLLPVAALPCPPGLPPALEKVEQTFSLTQCNPRLKHTQKEHRR